MSIRTTKIKLWRCNDRIDINSEMFWERQVKWLNGVNGYADNQLEFIYQENDTIHVIKLKG
jgi:hypothetical protein